MQNGALCPSRKRPGRRKGEVTMKNIPIANGALQGSEIALGCMRIAGMSQKEASVLIGTALEQGINFFDHADIYGGGRSEEVFAEALEMTPAKREQIIIQSKCGIREGYYDFSAEHILRSVEKSLARLKTDYLDALLLHRPDTLMEPEEVADAFAQLHASGKVRYFGVSNQNPMQMELLSRYLGRDIVINQLQLSVANTGMFDAGFHVNMQDDASVVRDGGVLEYCRLKGVTIQAWSPFQYGFFEGTFIGSPKYPELNQKLEELAAAKGVTSSAIAVAWILRHPAKIQTIVGTTNPARLKEICRASEILLSRPEWYDIYRSAGNRLP